LQDPDLQLPVRQIRHSTPTPLLEACKLGNPEIVEILLQDGRSDPTATMLGGCPSASIIFASDPPFEAEEEVLQDYLQVLQLLIDDGRADPGACQSQALINAATKGFTAAVQLLLQQPAVDPAAGESQALRVASWYGYPDIAEILLADGRSDPNAFKDFNFYDPRGYKRSRDSTFIHKYANTNALGAAVMGENLDIVEMLLDYPTTDPTAGFVNYYGSGTDPHASPAIVWAAEVGDIDILQVLLEDGRADPSVGPSGKSSSQESTAVVEAIRQGNLAAVQLLLADERVITTPAAISNYLAMARNQRADDIVAFLENYPRSS
jgi:ankyrin repeat protein